jgi:photosystem II stability/assembly factor-like uncharacterized protein
MKKLLLLILFFFTIYSQSNSQWVQLNIGNGFNILDFSFPNAQTGYICGYGGLFKKTTNGGTNWTDLSFPTTQFNINAIHFFDANTGLVAPDNDTIYRTTNGTNNWTNKIFIGIQVLDFQFFDSLNGYASGNNKFAKTANGGLNWTVSNIQSSGQIYFVNQNTGWTLHYPTSGSSTILKTTDAGGTWQVQYTTSNFRVLYDVFFINENTGYVSGYRHSIYKTTDSGLSWVSQHDESNAGGLYSIYFINANTGWTVGDYYSTTNTSTYYTTNGGINWMNNNGISTGGRLNRVKINNSPVGYIAGQNQNIYRTTNAGGLTGVEIHSEITPAGYSLSQNYPNPFNPTTVIRYQLSVDSWVSLRVYDLLGKEISTLVNNETKPGAYEVTFDGSNLPSGIYFYKLTVNNISDTKRMLMIK